MSQSLPSQNTGQVSNCLPTDNLELGNLPDGLHDEMYSQDGPLGTFARKISMAAAYEAIGPISRENLRLIRHIRNAFAHAKVPITFQTPQVAAACGELQRVNIFDPPEEVDQSPQMTPRARFEIVCAETMIRLSTYAGRDVKFTKDDGSLASAARRGSVPSLTRSEMKARISACLPAAICTGEP
jgi:hypothetical protein